MQIYSFLKSYANYFISFSIYYMIFIIITYVTYYII